MDVNGIFSSGGVGETLRINSPVASRQNRSFLLDRLGSSGVTHTPTSNALRMTIAEARDGLGAASAELTRALRALSNETRPVYTYSTTTRGPVMAIARGASARLADTEGGPTQRSRRQWPLIHRPRPTSLHPASSVLTSSRPR